MQRCEQNYKNEEIVSKVKTLRKNIFKEEGKINGKQVSQRHNPDKDKDIASKMRKKFENIDKQH